MSTPTRYWQRFSGRTHQIAWALIGAIVMGAGALLFRAAWQDSMAIDEEFAVHSGSCVLHTGLIDLDPTWPAGTHLESAAGVLFSGVPTSTSCPSGNFSDTTYHTLFDTQPTIGQLHELTFSVRIIPVLMTIGLILLCAWWAYRMAGPIAGVLTAALVGFDPTVQAMGHLVSDDMFMTVGFVAALCMLWKWSRDQRMRWVVTSGVAMGVALIGKVSAVVLVPILLILMFGSLRGDLRTRLQSGWRPALVLLGSAYAVIFCAYAPFNHSEPSQAWLPNGFNWLVPESWFYTVHRELAGATGSGGGLFYINGQAGYGGNWWYYFEALALKSTIAALVACAIGLAILVWKRRIGTLAWCVFPAVVYLIGAVHANLDIGIRYLLPVIVLLWIASAVGVASLPRLRVPLAAILSAAAIIAVTVGPVGSIGYFNAFATGRHSYYLSDSNIDYGQDMFRLKDWWKSAGEPVMQIDDNGPFPPSWYIPNAIDISPMYARGDYGSMPLTQGALAAISVDMGTIFSDAPYAIANPTCMVGESIVITNRTC